MFLNLRYYGFLIGFVLLKLCYVLVFVNVIEFVLLNLCYVLMFNLCNRIYICNDIFFIWFMMNVNMIFYGLGF